MAKYNKLIWIAMLFLSLTYVFAANKVYTQDFENLSIGYNITNFNANDIFCQDSNCVVTPTGPTGTARAIIMDEGGNQFLRLESNHTQSLNSNRAARVKLNTTDIFFWNATDIIYKFQMRVIDENVYKNFGDPSRLGDDGVNIFAFSPTYSLSSNHIIVSSTAGYNQNPIALNWIDGSDNQSYASLEYVMSMFTTTSFSPYNAIPSGNSNEYYNYMGICHMGQNEWTDVVIKYDIVRNGLNENNITNMKIYLDNTLCYDLDIPASVQIVRADVYKMFDFMFYAKTFTYDIDDFMAYTEFDNNVLIEDDLAAASSSTCPFPNCVFYDNFDYPINATKWFYPIIANLQVTNIDDIMYFGNSGYNNIETYDFEDYSDDLDIVIDFNLNATDITPSYLKNTPIQLQMDFKCEDSGEIVNSLIVTVTRNDAFTGAANKSIIGFYDLEGSDLTSIGQIKYNNGETSRIRIEYSFTDDKLYYNIFNTELSYWSRLSNNGFLSRDMVEDCSRIETIYFNRLDSSNFNYGYFGVDTIAAYTDKNSFSEIMSDYYGDDFNTSAIDNKTVSIDDILQNAASGFGFSSAGGKLLFWLIIMVLCTGLAMLFIKTDGIIKAFIGAIVFIGMFIVGWSMSFISTSVFAFIILVAAIIIGFFVKSQLTG
jgi:hypothetical protein